MNNKEAKQITFLNDIQMEDLLDRWGEHIAVVLRNLTPYGSNKRLFTLSGLPVGSSSPHPIDEVQDKIEMLNESLKETIEAHIEKGQKILLNEFDKLKLEVSQKEYDELQHISKKTDEHIESFKGKVIEGNLVCISSVMLMSTQ